MSIVNFQVKYKIRRDLIDTGNMAKISSSKNKPARKEDLKGKKANPKERDTEVKEEAIKAKEEGAEEDQEETEDSREAEKNPEDDPSPNTNLILPSSELPARARSH